MIIDIHAHIFNKGWISEVFWEQFSVFPSTLHRKTRKGGAGLIRDPALLWDPSGEKLIAEMDKAGITFSVIFGLDWGLTDGVGDTAVSIVEQNRLIAEIAVKHSSRLISFCAIDPRRPNALDILKRAVEAWGMKGVKLHPSTGFYPDDRAFYPLYEWISDHKLPILVHSGVVLPPLRSKYTRPIYFDDVLVDFPDINIIAAHLGTGWWEELASMATRRANLFMEISGWQQTASLYPDSFSRILKRIIEIAGAEAILFGSDSPAYRNLPIIQTEEWVQIIQNLGQSTETNFTREQVEAILGGNASLLLGLR